MSTHSDHESPIGPDLAQAARDAGLDPDQFTTPGELLAALAPDPGLPEPEADDANRAPLLSRDTDAALESAVRALAEAGRSRSD